MHPLAVSVEGGVWSLMKAFDTICRIKLHNKFKTNFIPVADINSFDVSDACMRADHVINNWSKTSYMGQYCPLLGRTGALGHFSKWDLTAGFSFHSVFCLCNRKIRLHRGKSPLTLKKSWKFFANYQCIES